MNCVDLFAGAGGFSLAAIQAGMKVKVAIEKDRHACLTYRNNLINNGFPHLYEEDIKENWLLNNVAAHFKGSDTCDLLLGGPPCQGFSILRANKKEESDERNYLVLRYFDFVRKLRPKVFLMENVPGILWKKHKDFLAIFYKESEKSGYNVAEPVILDARDYGVPQRRRRVFILGVRKNVKHSINWPPFQTHGSPEMCHKYKSLKPWKTAAEVFDKKQRSDDPNNLHMNHTKELISVFKSTPLNGGSRK
ncbi:MAG: DNA cytosine methyltransferase, partial [Magnetococcales bacterium]|nr:DNA cytosine methyltransferase [Magnetococcales bacterium]